MLFYSRSTISKLELSARSLRSSENTPRRNWYGYTHLERYAFGKHCYCAGADAAKKIAELSAAHLLLRVSLPDRLDGPPMYKCGISYDVALALGRELRVPMLDLIWESG